MGCPSYNQRIHTLPKASYPAPHLSRMPHRGGSAIGTSREVSTMDLDSGIREIANAILAFPTAAMLLVAFWQYVTRNRRDW